MFIRIDKTTDTRVCMKNEEPSTAQGGPSPKAQGDGSFLHPMLRGVEGALAPHPLIIEP